MRKSLILVPVVMTVLTVFSTNTAADTNEAKKETTQTTVTTVSTPLYYTVTLPVEAEENKRPQYNVPLPDNILDYIWQRSNKSNISYSMLLGLAETESQFKIDLVSSTDDVGLFQIHRSTAKWIAEQMGVKDYNLKDAKTNIDFMIFYLNYLRDYWNAKGVSDEQLFKLMIISYHRGCVGAERYIQNHGYNDPYLNKVKEYKSKIESGE